MQRLDLRCDWTRRRWRRPGGLARDYPSLSDQSRAMELRQRGIGRGYWQLLINAYLDSLARLKAGEKDAEAIRPQLGVLYGRLIGALAARLKWDQFATGRLTRNSG